MILEIHRGNLSYWFVPIGRTPPDQALSTLDDREADVHGGQPDLQNNVEHRRLTITNMPEAFALLRPLAIDTLLMPDFRRMAENLGLSKLNNRRDGEILNYLALQMAAQRLFVIRRLVVPRGIAEDLQPKPAAPPPPAGGARPKEDEPDPETFDPEIQQDQQAAALIAASKDGVPFCEECARLAAQKNAA